MGCKYRLKYKVCVVCDRKPTADCKAAGHQIAREERGPYMIKWSINGKAQIASTGTTNAKEADAILALKEGAKAAGVPITSKVGKIRFEAALGGIERSYQLKKRRSAETLKYRFAQLKPFFGGRRMVDIKPPDIEAYQIKRQKEGAQNSTINRELQILRRMFTLARKNGDLLHDHVPDFELLPENPARQGFFEREQFDSVLAHLPERLRNIATFGYFTGWRVGEVKNLQWANVNRKTGELRIDTSKNGEGRSLRYAAMPELQDVIDEQWKVHERLLAQGTISPWVFPKLRGSRPGDRVGNFRGAWRVACREAGCPGRLFHDFRRTVARNLTRRGVAEQVAMRITGHKTRTMFQRYNIVADGDVAEALSRLSDRPASTSARHG